MPAKRRKHIPLRSCLVCRETMPKRALIRIVRTPEGTIEIDPKGKRAGRGTYLCSKEPCWEAAFEQKRLSQALKCQVTAEDAVALRTAASLLIEQLAVDSQTTVSVGVGARG